MKQLPIRNKVLFVSLAGIIAISGGAAAYQYFGKPNESAEQVVGPINYDPPTQEEKNQVQAHKEELAGQHKREQNSQPNSGKQLVTPVITNASQTEHQIIINSYIGGIFEDGGICTATFTKGGTQLIKKSTAFANATTTDCPPIFVNSSEFFSKGDWQITMAYNSANAAGISQPKTLTVE